MTLPAIRPEEAARLLREGAVLVDVREPDEHARERIPGARNLPLAGLEQAELAPPRGRPVLFHCRSGADRTGLAAALYLMECEGEPLERAWGKGLSIVYGHVPVGGYAELDRFLALYRKDADRFSFEQWVREEYPAIFRREWVPAEPPRERPS